MFTSPRPRPATCKRARLVLEALEDRTLLSVVKWTGADAAVSTNWSDPKNWSSDTSPVAGDTVIFDNTAQNDTSNVDGAYLSAGDLGDLQIDWGGTITIASGVTLSAQNTELTNGSVNAAGTLAVSGALTWLNGTISGTGTVNANGTMALGAADGNNYDEFLNGCTLNNAGSASWLSQAGWFDQQNASVFNNLPEASLTIQSALIWYNDQDNSTFNNAGSVTEAVSSGTSTFDVAFDNSGSVLVQSGTLSLAGGGTDSGSFSVPAGTLGFDGDSSAITTNSTASISGAGTVEFGSSGIDMAGPYSVSGTTLVGGANEGGGTVNFSGATPATTQNLTIMGGTLTATGTVNVSGALTWLNGTISGTGTVNANGTLVIGAAGGNSYEEFLNGCTLNNTGSASWLSQAGWFDQQNASVFNNLAGASLTIQSALTWYNDQDNSTFNNAGSVTEAVSSGTSTFDVAFDNSGSVLVQSGTLSLAGGGTDSGSFSVPAGTLAFDGDSTAIMTNTTASISGAGTVEFGTSSVDMAGTYSVSGTTLVGGANEGGGTVNFSGATPATTQNLTIMGGTLTATGTVNVAGALTWPYGIISGAGTVNANGTLVLGAANAIGDEEYLEGCTLNNAGSASWLVQDGEFYQGNASVFNNLASGTLNVQGFGSWANDGIDNCIFNNAGTLIKTAGPGTTFITVAFNDSGSVAAQAGTLALDSGSVTVNGSGLLSCYPDASIAISGNLLGNTQDADLFDPQGTILLKRGNRPAAPQQLEVMSEDLGDVAAGFVNNFAYGTLKLGDDTYVQLVNQAQNSPGTGPEALYVQNLVVPAGCTLDLNGLAVYARALQVDGTILNGSIHQIPPGGPLALDSSTSGIINSTNPTNAWTFFGRANQEVSVIVNPGDPSTPPAPLQPNLGFAQVQILNASGTVLASGTSAEAGAVVNLLGVTLPADGTYQIIVSAPSAEPGSTGNYTMVCFDATTDTAALSLDQTTYGQLYTPYQLNDWTFSALANDQVDFQLLNEASPGIEFDLTGPNGYTAFADANTSSGLITLPTSGNYLLTVHSTAGQTGAYAFDLQPTSQTSLVLGTTYQGTLQASNQAELFTVNVPQAGSQLLAYLGDTSSADQNELYLSLGTAPTRSSYQYRYTNLASANQQILVPSAGAGTWYILLYGADVPTPSPFFLVPTAASSVLTGSTPDRYGTNGAAILTLTGGGFDNTTTVQLVGAGGTTYAASSTLLVSATQITATFDAGSVPPGEYSVAVANAQGGGSTTLPNSFTMVQGGQPDLHTQIIVPNPVGRHLPSVIYVDYSNTGDLAMPAPVLEVTAATANGLQGALLTLNPALANQGFETTTDPAGYGQSVQILASGSTPGILEPGESEVVPVYEAGWLMSQGADIQPLVYFTLTIYTADDTAAIDWSSLQDSLQPPTISAAAWNIIYPNLTAQIGTTWGNYVSSLDSAASFFGFGGQNVQDVSQLWQYEVEQADDATETAPVEWTQDLQAPAAGLAPAIDRGFADSVSGREQVGPFGAGWVWTNGFGLSLVTLPDGDVTITGDGGSETFEYYWNHYVSTADDGSTLSANGSGGFTLTEAGGQVIGFAADGTESYVTDATGDTVTAGYTNGLLTSLTAPSGANLKITYNTAGRIISATSSTGQTTTYSYDSTNTYLTSVTGPDGTLTYTYVPATGTPSDNALLSVQHPDGTQDLYTYDSQGQLATFESGYTVSGQVTDGSGNPLAGATVTLYSEADYQTQFSGTTQPNGSYQIQGVPAGTYDLVVLANGFLAGVTTGVTVAGATANGSSKLVTSTTTVTGTVVDSNGDVIAGATVDILDSVGRTIGTALSAANGSFVITTASGNNLTLQILVPGSDTPKQQTVSIPVGTTVQLGQIDPTLPDWLQQLIDGGHQRSPDEVDDYPPPTNPCCLQAEVHLQNLINAELNTWDQVASADQNLIQGAIASAAVFVAEDVKLAADLTLLAGSGFALAGIGGATTAGIGLISSASSLISNLIGYIEGLQDTNSLQEAVDVFNSIVGGANSLNDIARQLQGLADAGADGLSAQAGVFTGLLSVGSDVYSFATTTVDSLDLLNALAAQANAVYQTYLNYVTLARAALQAYLDCEKQDTTTNCQTPPAPPPPPLPPSPQPLGGIPGGGGSSAGVGSQDPNALDGPAGYGPSSFVADTTPLPYRIDFENAATATAPAQSVSITEQLDPNLNLATFQLTGIGFGFTNIEIPAGSQYYQTTVSTTDNGQTFNVDITASLNPATGLLTVTFQSIDPSTNLPPTNLLTGFLPPENGTGIGEGYVSFIIDAKSNLPTGTQIRDVALVSFDGAPTIATDQVNDEDPSQGVDPTKQALVTVDAGPPTSRVSGLPATESSPSFTVSWSGQGDPGGSGIGSFNIYVSDNGGPYTIWQAGTTQTSATFNGSYGNTYAFYSVANDNVGNLQPTPSVAQATTYLAAAPTSAVNPLPTSTTNPTFGVSWSGSPGTGATSVASYQIFVSTDGGSFQPFLTGTTQTSATFTGLAGHTYSFYSVATSNLGLVQPTPTAPQATIQVVATPLVTITGVSELVKKGKVTKIVVTFSGLGDSTEADSVATYRLVSPGKHGSFTAKNAKTLKLKSASYDQATNKVSLVPQKSFPSSDKLELVVDGVPPSGLQDSLGRLIDGNDDGQPGGNAVAILSHGRATIDAISLGLRSGPMFAERRATPLAVSYGKSAHQVTTNTRAALVDTLLTRDELKMDLETRRMRSPS